MYLKLKLKHIFITSVIIALSISANNTTTITTFAPPIKQVDDNAAVAATTAFALSDEERFDSGYSHGCSDAKTGDHQYLDNSGGESSHTATFMRGYDDGHIKCLIPDSEQNDDDDDDDDVSDSNAKGTDSEQNDEIPLSKQKENTNSPYLPNPTSFHALVFPKIHFGAIVLIVLSLNLVLSVLGLVAFRRLRRRRRRKIRERKGFPNHVKENILRTQDHKCARCRKILNVVDWDHKNGDRSNNKETNCQALCPNCHAIKTRKEQSKR